MDAPRPPLPLNKLTELSTLRDSLGDYLSAVERNTDAVNNWLRVNKEKIILAHHRLERAFVRNDEAAAVALLAEMGDVAGFVLSLQDFRSKSEAAFGMSNAFLTAASSIADSLPSSLQEPLPELKGSEEVSSARIELENLPPGPEETKKWHSSISGWFNREEKKQQELEHGYRKQMRHIKSEILGLQSDRHYYIDSFMDWIVETMEPQPDAAAPDARAKMLQYQNPAYIVACAHADYREAVETNARAIRDAALEYAHLASAIDTQDIPRLEATLRPTAYPQHYRDDVRVMLLKDYQSASLTELILTHVKDRKDQATLLRSSLYAEKDSLAFSDTRTPQDIFEKFMQLMLDEKNPLEPAAILSLLQTMKRADGFPRLETLVFPAARENIFRRITQRFENDLPAQRSALDTILFSMDGKKMLVGHGYVDLYDGLQQKQPAETLRALRRIEDNGSAPENLALLQLCHPGSSFYRDILAVSDDPQIKGQLLEQAVQSGLLHELRNDPSSRHAEAGAFKNLFEQDIFPALDTFPLSAARTLIAHSFSTGGLEKLRDLLTLPHNNWLKKVITSNISDRKKTEWIAALLEPFKSDVIRANILAEAAEKYTILPNAPTPTLLTALEENLVGKNIPLSPDRFLCNLHLIADIWYNADAKRLQYTMNGQYHTLLENLSPAMGQELLSVIGRRSGFVKEHDALFNPRNVDQIEFEPAAIYMHWYGLRGALNIDSKGAEELEKHPDFLHAANGATGYAIYHNVASICMLQEQDDGTVLLLDKYGATHVLTGGITYDFTKSPLVPAGAGTWFNPDNAAILQLHPERNSFGFRIMSASFEDEMKKIGQFFYEVNVGDDKTFARLADAVQNASGMHPIDPAVSSPIYLNMQALGYLALDEAFDGFYCRRHSRPPQQGFIQMDPDMTEKILESLGMRQGVTRLGGLLMHEGSIDSIHYDSRTNKLQFVSGRDVQEFQTGRGARASDALADLLQKKSIVTVTQTSDVGKKVPADIVDLDRVTLASYNGMRAELQVTAQDLPIPIQATPKEVRAFFDQIQKHGLEQARQKTAAHAWTQDLGAVLSSLPVFPVRVPASPGRGTPKELLQQALGKTKPTDGKTLKNVFATVASLPAEGRCFSYPEEQAPPENAPGKKKKPKSPRL